MHVQVLALFNLFQVLPHDLVKRIVYEFLIVFLQEIMKALYEGGFPGINIPDNEQVSLEASGLSVSTFLLQTLDEGSETY